MNRIKEIATSTFKSLPMDNNKPEQWIDNFVLAYTKAILFEATDVIREKAKEHPNEVGTVLKATAIDVLDHFGL
jgi:hypothetical protein